MKGRLVTKAPLAPGSTPQTVALGDLNGAGRLDIAVPYGISSGGTRVIFND